MKLRAADRAAITSALPHGAALVEFVHLNIFDFTAVPAQSDATWKPAHYVAFVLLIGKPDEVQMIDLGGAKSIDHMMSEYRMSIIGELEGGHEQDVNAESLDLFQVSVRNDRDTLYSAIATVTRHLGARPMADRPTERTRLGTALRKAVFDPLLPAIAGHTQLLLSPDGDLAQLPFEVLPVEGKHYLIDDYQISYLSVGRDVLRFKAAATGQPTDPQVVADPDFDLTSGDRSAFIAGMSFPRLAGAHQEGEAIGTLLDQEPSIATHSPHRQPRLLLSQRVPRPG